MLPYVHITTYKRLDKVLRSPSTLGVAGNTEECYNLWFHTEITPYSAETHEQYRQASYWSDRQWQAYIAKQSPSL